MSELRPGEAELRELLERALVSEPPLGPVVRIPIPSCSRPMAGLFTWSTRWAAR